jgi:hypothetical protein
MHTIFLLDKKNKMSTSHSCVLKKVKKLIIQVGVLSKFILHNKIKKNILTVKKNIY